MAHDGAIVTVTTLAVVAGSSIIAWILYKKFYASPPLHSLRHSKPFLTNKSESKSVTLVSKKSLTHDVRQFRFQLPKEDQTLGILAGEHIKLTADVSYPLTYPPSIGIPGNTDHVSDQFKNRLPILFPHFETRRTRIL